MTELPDQLRAGSDPLTRALLPVLVHEVKGATQLLVGLRSILEVPGGEAFFEKRAPDLSQTSERMHELGFAMAVLATASGADMLMARREATGLRTLIDLAQRAASFDGGPTPPMEGEPPLVAPGALDGWQVPWAGGALVGLCRGRDWAWIEAGVLRGRLADGGAPSPDEAEIVDLVRRRTPGAGLDSGPGAEGDLVWSLPAPWLG